MNANINPFQQTVGTERNGTEQIPISFSINGVDWSSNNQFSPAVPCRAQSRIYIFEHYFVGDHCVFHCFSSLSSPLYYWNEPIDWFDSFQNITLRCSSNSWWSSCLSGPLCQLRNSSRISGRKYNNNSKEQLHSRFVVLRMPHTTFFRGSSYCRSCHYSGKRFI